MPFLGAKEVLPLLTAVAIDAERRRPESGVVWACENLSVLMPAPAKTARTKGKRLATSFALMSALMPAVGLIPARIPLKQRVLAKLTIEIRELLAKRPHALLRPGRGGANVGELNALLGRHLSVRGGAGRADDGEWLKGKPRPRVRSPERNPLARRAHLPGGHFSGVVQARGIQTMKGAVKWPKTWAST